MEAPVLPRYPGRQNMRKGTRHDAKRGTQKSTNRQMAPQQAFSSQSKTATRDITRPSLANAGRRYPAASTTPWPCQTNTCIKGTTKFTRQEKSKHRCHPQSRRPTVASHRGPQTVDIPRNSQHTVYKGGAKKKTQAIPLSPGKSKIKSKITARSDPPRYHPVAHQPCCYFHHRRPQGRAIAISTPPHAAALRYSPKTHRWANDRPRYRPHQTPVDLR